MKQPDSTLLAAKVLSVSRLLLKTLSQTGSPLPVLETLRDQLASLRRNLLRRVDQRLSNLRSSQEQLVGAICAFCLATSSSSSDALRHYHHLRLQELRRVLDTREAGNRNVVHALRYYTNSLQITKAILGRPLSEALRALKIRPILRDPVVQQLDDLDLETLRRWVAKEIQDFVPFITHKDWTKADIDSTISAWSKDAFQSFVEILRDKLEDLHNTEDLLSLRRALFETWLPICASTPSHSAPKILETLRGELNQRMKRLISTEADALTTIGSAVTSAVDAARDVKSPVPSVWDKAFITMQTAKGASAFKHQLRMRHLGITESVSTTLHSLEVWISQIKMTELVAQQLRKDRWQDQIDEDETDDEGPITIERMLTKDDSEVFEAEQKRAVVQAVFTFQTSIRDASTGIETEQTISQVQVLLHIIREVCQRLHHAFSTIDLAMLRDIVPDLHRRLAIDVAAMVFSTLVSSKQATQLSTLTASSQLWDGTPLLPMQPSPHVFKLLYKLSQTMADLGADLWTTAAVDALKSAIGQRVLESPLFTGTQEQKAQERDDVNGLTNGTSVLNGITPQPSNAAHVMYIQSLFDAYYLNYALCTARVGEVSQQFAGMTERLTALAGLEDSYLKIVRERAKDYWTRTSLLFSLLA